MYGLSYKYDRLHNKIWNHNWVIYSYFGCIRHYTSVALLLCCDNIKDWSIAVDKKKLCGYTVLGLGARLHFAKQDPRFPLLAHFHTEDFIFWQRKPVRIFMNLGPQFNSPSSEPSSSPNILTIRHPLLRLSHVECSDSRYSSTSEHVQSRYPSHVNSLQLLWLIGWQGALSSKAMQVAEVK